MKTAYAKTAVLAKIAEFLYVPGIGMADWKEDLKCRAALRKITYGPDVIDRALTIAEKRLRESGKWQVKIEPAPLRKSEALRIPSDREAHRVFRELLAHLANVKKL